LQHFLLEKFGIIEELIIHPEYEREKPILDDEHKELIYNYYIEDFKLLKYEK